MRHWLSAKGALIAGLATVITIVSWNGAAAYHTTGWLNTNLPDYANTLNSKEQDAVSGLSDPTCPGGKYSRTCLNQEGLAYWTNSWITWRDQQNNTSGTYTVATSTTNVPLQLNSFFFYRASTASKQPSTTVGLGTLNYGMNAVNVANLSRLNGGDAVDSNPADSPAINAAPIKSSESQIVKVKILNGGGQVPTQLDGKIIGTDMSARDSRYYFNEVDFNYNPQNWDWWTSGNKTLTLEFTLQTVQGYTDGTYQCLYDGSGQTVGKTDYNKCPEYTIDKNITFDLQPTWSVTASTQVLSGSTAYPGQTIQWQHTVTNQGSGATDQKVYYYYKNGTGLPAGTGSTTGHNLPSGSSAGRSASFTSSYLVQGSDLGKTICRSTVATPTNWRGSGTTESSQQCVRIVYNYNLTPIASFAGGTGSAYPPGSDGIAVNTGVQNTGPTMSDTTDWELAQCVFAPSANASSYAAVGDNGSNGRATYAAMGGNCTDSNPGWTGTTVSFPANLYTTVENLTDESIPATTPIGSHICYILSVRPPSSASAGGTWRHSTPACIAVVKTPRIQILGADARADTVITGGEQKLGGIFYGSWAEYAVFGIHQIAGIGTGGSLAGGSATDPGSKLTSLTFSNTTTPLGDYYSTPPEADTYYNAYVSQATETHDGNYYSGSGPGQKYAVVYVTGNLIINSNIEYPGSYASLSDIPRVIYVVSQSIIVDPSVTRIDAWLIAKGTLYTCSDDTNPVRKQLTVNDCNNQLVFNGPVYVGDTRLSRTYGADATTGNPGDPAEIFNLAPSNYLSSYTASVSANNIRTVYEKELPPRW